MLAAYDAQVRTALASNPPSGDTLEWDGPLPRCTGGFRGFVNYRDLGGLEGDDLQALIDRTVAHYRARGEAFEWKTHAHDAPADLPDRLRTAGFEAWQGRGIYKALVARRAQLAVARGIEYLQVDASEDSRPILERLGFTAITHTTPYIWSP